MALSKIGLFCLVVWEIPFRHICPNVIFTKYDVLKIAWFFLIRKMVVKKRQSNHLKRFYGLSFIFDQFSSLK